MNKLKNSPHQPCWLLLGKLLTAIKFTGKKRNSQKKGQKMRSVLPLVFPEKGTGNSWATGAEMVGSAMRTGPLSWRGQHFCFHCHQCLRCGAGLAGRLPEKHPSVVWDYFRPGAAQDVTCLEGFRVGGIIRRMVCVVKCCKKTWVCGHCTSDGL